MTPLFFRKKSRELLANYSRTSRELLANGWVQACANGRVGGMGGGRNERRNENLYYQPPAGWSQAPQVLTNAPPVRRRNHIWVDYWLIHYVEITK
jgi:hypothetical protein